MSSFEELVMGSTTLGKSDSKKLFNHYVKKGFDLESCLNNMIYRIYEQRAFDKLMLRDFVVKNQLWPDNWSTRLRNALNTSTLINDKEILQLRASLLYTTIADTIIKNPTTKTIKQIHKNKNLRNFVKKIKLEELAESELSILGMDAEFANKGIKIPVTILKQITSSILKRYDLEESVANSRHSAKKNKLTQSDGEKSAGSNSPLSPSSIADEYQNPFDLAIQTNASLVPNDDTSYKAESPKTPSDTEVEEGTFAHAPKIKKNNRTRHKHSTKTSYTDLPPIELKDIKHQGIMSLQDYVHSKYLDQQEGETFKNRSAKTSASSAQSQTTSEGEEPKLPRYMQLTENRRNYHKSYNRNDSSFGISH